MSLLQPLFNNNLDIIGDVHGELDALRNLIKVLGYDEKGFHKENRKLVFVGDLVDRGPNSPGVVLFVKSLIDNGNAQMILGNHEINVLQHKAKSGAGWYFHHQIEKDQVYQPFKTSGEEEKQEIYQFLSGLPIALENENLRIVHAAWIGEKIEQVKKISLGNIAESYMKLEEAINENVRDSGLLYNYYLEQDEWMDDLEDPYAEVPFLQYTCEYNLIHQMNNPLRVLTSGVEKKAEVPFFASGKWRFVQRDNWWDHYQDNKPVIVGHFWRKISNNTVVKNENVFKGIDDYAWHGVKKNVFCIDYSVGARFLERKKELPFMSLGKLAALRWPEGQVVFEDGNIFNTSK